MSLWQCPLCHKELNKFENQYRCPNNHQFDVAKQGYINLLMSQTSKEKQHGDSKEMVLARSNFLEKGYYKPFRDTLEMLIKKYDAKTVLDIGCGEGWYDERLEVETLYGIDISKDAIKLAARRLQNYKFAVASSFALPNKDASMDLCYSVFAPFNIGEVFRVLKEGGIFIEVFPLPKHLFDLKHVLYDNPYLNPDYTTEYENLTKLEVQEVSAEIKLESQEDIQNLFKMTPYYHRTQQDHIEKLNYFLELNTEIGFGFAVFRKD